MKKIITIIATIILLPIFIGPKAQAGTMCPCSCGCQINSNPCYSAYPTADFSLLDYFKGKFIKRDNGYVYFVNKNGYVYDLNTFNSPLFTLGQGGFGIDDIGIQKIKVGTIKMYGLDSDRDGLSNDFEKAINTSPYNFNTDRDRYSDFTEITNGYNPNGADKNKMISYDLAQKLSGQILLQSQNEGQLWYLNPGDQKRYFLGSRYDLNDIVNKFAVRISETDYGKLVR